MIKSVSVPPIFLQVFYKQDIKVATVSTAGPKPQVCKLAPIVMCADMEDPPSTKAKDSDCLDDGWCFGYQIGAIRNLVVACNGAKSSCPANSLEAGNYSLLDVGSGANAIRDALRGTLDVCAPGAQTEPGFDWGQLKAGIDEKFDSKSAYGDTQVKEYKGDPYTIVSGSSSTPKPPPFTGGSPYTRYFNGTDGVGNGKRELAVAIADCRGLQNGKTDLVTVGTACMFITEKAIQDGSVKGVNAEFVAFCQQSGPSDPVESVLYGTYDIVLYKTEGSGDS